MYVKVWLRKWLLAAIVCLLLMLGCISIGYSFPKNLKIRRSYTLPSNFFVAVESILYIQQLLKVVNTDRQHIQERPLLVFSIAL